MMTRFSRIRMKQNLVGIGEGQLRGVEREGGRYFWSLLQPVRPHWVGQWAAG